jgi:hypothetical protein
MSEINMENRRKTRGHISLKRLSKHKRTWARKSYFARLIYRTLLPQIIIFSGRYNTSSATFQEIGSVKKRVSILLSNRSAFFEIQSIPERWAQVIDVEGNNFDAWTYHYYIFKINESLKKNFKLETERSNNIFRIILLSWSRICMV